MSLQFSKTKIYFLRWAILVSAVLALSVCTNDDARARELAVHKPRLEPLPLEAPPPKEKRPLFGIFVNERSTAGSPDGKSWATAFKTIKQAISTAVPGENIYVAAGTYKGADNFPIDLKDRENVRLIGGYKAGAQFEKDDFSVADDEWVVLDGEAQPSSLVSITGKAKGIAFLGGFEFSNVKGGTAVVIEGNSKTEPITDVRFVASRFRNNENDIADVNAKGGALRVKFVEDLRLDDVDAHNNRSGGYGGFAYIVSSKRINCNKGKWEKNKAVDKSGGAMFAEKVERVIVSGHTVAENFAYLKAGGLGVSKGKNIEIKDIKFFKNSADTEEGGAISLNNIDNTTMARVSFDHNNAATRGGALNVDTGENLTIRLDDNEVKDNKSLVFGGAFYIQDIAGLTFTGGRFENNVTEVLGGSIVFDEVSNLRMENTAIYGGAAVSQADSGAGMALLKVGENNVLRNISMTGLTAKDSGGALALIGVKGKAVVTIENSTFENNKSTENGGAIFTKALSRYKLTFKNTLFSNNTTDNYGGALALDGKTDEKTKFVIGEGTRFINNYAKQKNGGGAIYVVFDPNKADAAADVPSPLDRQLVFFNTVSDIKNNKIGDGNNGQDLRIGIQEISSTPTTPSPNDAPAENPGPRVLLGAMSRKADTKRIRYFMAYTTDPDSREPWDRIKYDVEEDGSTTTYAY